MSEPIASLQDAESAPPPPPSRTLRFIAIALAAIGFLFDFSLVRDLQFSMFLLVGGAQILLALLTGALLLAWTAVRRRSPDPILLLAWLSLWSPLVLGRFQSRFVNGRIEKIGPSRILKDAAVLLKQDGAKQEDWGANRLSRYDPQVGPALRELGFLYLMRYPDRLEIKMDGTPESYEGLVVRVEGVTPGPVDWSQVNQWRPQPREEGMPSRQLRTIAPGIEWLSWEH